MLKVFCIDFLYVVEFFFCVFCCVVVKVFSKSVELIGIVFLSNVCSIRISNVVGNNRIFWIGVIVDVCRWSVSGLILKCNVWRIVVKCSNVVMNIFDDKVLVEKIGV